MSLAEKLFGSFSDRELKKINPITKKVLALEPKYQAMADAELQAQTPALKERLANGETLDDILPDAFAVCREAAWRVLGMKHFPVQVTGGIALHRGAIAEMQTGEGKTLVATLPAYLNALTGEGVHVVTVNDYLAKRDSEWMGKLYRWLGLEVGLIVQGIDGDARRRAYNADITYGTNNEFGFDYLRDNMVTYKDNMVQRGHAFAIVDEVDSILIDEARTDHRRRDPLQLCRRLGHGPDDPAQGLRPPGQGTGRRCGQLGKEKIKIAKKSEYDVLRFFAIRSNRIRRRRTSGRYRHCTWRPLRTSRHRSSPRIRGSGRHRLP